MTEELRQGFKKNAAFYFISILVVIVIIIFGLSGVLKGSHLLGVLNSISFWLLLVSPILTLLHVTVKGAVRDLGDDVGDDVKDHDFLSNYYMHTFILLSAVIVAIHGLVPDIMSLSGHTDDSVPLFLIFSIFFVVTGIAVTFTYLAHANSLIVKYHAFKNHSSAMGIVPCWQAWLRVLVLNAFVLIDVLRVI